MTTRRAAVAHLAAAATAAAAGLLLSLPAGAQTFPTKPIRLVVPYPPAARSTPPPVHWPSA